MFQKNRISNYFLHPVSFFTELQILGMFVFYQIFYLLFQRPRLDEFLISLKKRPLIYLAILSIILILYFMHLFYRVCRFLHLSTYPAIVNSYLQWLKSKKNCIHNKLKWDNTLLCYEPKIFFQSIPFIIYN